jgi:two-component system cell cycle sensor histidine kinase/response regulator CckA
MPDRITDPARLAVLAASGLLDSPPEEEFDRVTRLVRRFLGVPVSMVSLIDRDRQFLKSAEGLGAAGEAMRSAPLVHSLCQHVVASGEPLVVADAREHPLLRKSRAITTLGAAAYAGIPLRTRSGAVLGTLCAVDSRPREWTADDVEVLRDLAAVVTAEIDRRLEEHQRLRSERALAQAEARFRSLFGSTTDAVVVADGDGRIVLWNPGAERIFGYTPGEALGQPVALVVPEGQQAAHSDGIRRHRETGEGRLMGTTAELTARHRDGHEVPVEVSLSSWTQDGGTYYGAVIRDATERVRTQAALRQAERDYHGLFDHAHDAILLLDPHDETVLDANRSACQLYGLSYGELVGSSLQAVSTSGDGGRRFRDEALRTGLLEGLEVEQRRRDGTLVTVEINATVVEYRGRKAILTINRDVTPRRAAMQARGEREARFRAAFEDAGVGMAMLGMDGRIVYSNRALQDMLGYTGAELRGRHVRDITHPDDVERNLDLFHGLVAERSGRYQLEKRYVHRDGHVVWTRVSSSLVHDPEGAPEFVMGIVEDLTEQRKAQKALEDRQRELLQAQKMEVVGRLAGGIAHDFNNLLTAIKGTLHLLLLDLPPGSPIRDDLEEIDRASSRAAELTAQLLTFSRKQMVQPQVVDVNDIVARAERLLRRLIGEDIDFRTALAPALWRVHADAGQVEQVLVNLVVNARDAMPQGGTLHVQTRNRRVAADDALAGTLGGPGDYACIEVQDSGVGIDAGNLSRIFDPFFTTKEVGKGTGLGLSTVYGIVSRAGGHVEVRSEPGHGALFRVYLPRAEGADAPEGGPEGPEAGSPGRGTETILLAEDEEVVRRLASRILRRAGYTVLEARDGSEALELCSRFEGPIDMLLTDTVMPGLSGPELAHRVTRARSGVRVLYTSGYTDDDVLRKGVQERGTAFIEKPFSPDALLRRVRDTLAARA